MAANGTFIWNELITSDEESCSHFYSSLLGWERKEVNTGEDRPYSIFLKDGHVMGGMLGRASGSENSRSHWEPYVAVDDVDACAGQITQLGGKITTAPHDIPVIGRVCVIRDPSGASLTLVTEKK